MAQSMLSQIHKDSNKWTICVFVSRMWHYRGGTDEGPIKHTDLVLLDAEVCASFPAFSLCHVSRLKFHSFFLIPGLIQLSFLQGTHMHGQVSEIAAGRLKDVLKEGKVFVIRKFLCNPSRTTYRPVESHAMVQITRFSIVEERPGAEDTYPFCTYSLTAFDDIPGSRGQPTCFFGELCWISVYRTG